LHPYRFSDLSPSQQKVLVSASYNNLIDWNISVDYEGVSFVYNRYRPPEFHIVREPLSKTTLNVLQSASFRRITAAHPTPDVPALDRAVIDTISLWKRQLGGELPGISNSALSALFNAILFVRAAEDHRRYKGIELTSPVLLESSASPDGIANFRLRDVVQQAMDRLEIRQLPSNLIDFEALRVFDQLDRALSTELLADFYRNRFARYYEFDFSLMSKHALSRIYEHYVSILRIPDSGQASFFPSLAEESLDRTYGNVYTPEYIARFFARYLRNQLPLRTFQRLRAIDPACGSGIFLRAFLELQNEVLWDDRTTESIRSTFDNVSGIDIDPNACHAARLSLSLLSLVLLGQFPSDLKIINADSLNYFLTHPDLHESADVVVANPPYVKFEAQTLETRDSVAAVLGDDALGRPDVYLAILKIALDVLKPGGFGLFVLPETFLKSDSAHSIRSALADSAWIRCLVDLTSVRVFEEVGVYTILLIFQKKSETLAPLRTAKVVQCQGNVSQALQDVLDDREVQSQFYTIYDVSQEAFAGGEWSLAPPSVALLLKKYSRLAELKDECSVRQGMNSGADDVFFFSNDQVAPNEKACFAPLLSDREMEFYRVPESTSKWVFYPFAGDEPLDEVELQKHFPETWKYLSSNRGQLEKRSAVMRGSLPWWRPERPRKPSEMLRPKIVTPHLVISPRFGLDLLGKYAISRAPMILSGLSGPIELEHLCYLLAILNSSPCFWDITRRSHVYDRGYSRLELATLKGIRVPSFGQIDRGTVRKLIGLTRMRMGAVAPKAFEIEAEIDDLVADLYGLSPEEKKTIGMLEAQ
jgi:methylase of polypeptide subunit release factors